MRARGSRVLVGLALVAGVSPLACAGILGDFSIGEGPSADGGTDGTQPTADGSGSNDGAQDSSNMEDSPSSQDAPGTDANEGGPAVALNCQIQGGSSPFLVGQIASTSNNYDLEIFNTSAAPGQTRYSVTVREQPSNGNGVYHVYTFGNGGGSANDTPVPNSNALSVVRYPTGIAALFSEYGVQSDGGSGNQLEVTLLADGASSWSPPIMVANADYLPGCSNDLNGELYVNNAAATDFYLVWTYQDCSTSTNHISATHYTGPASVPVPWPLPANPAGQRFQPAGIAPLGPNVFVMINGGNNGPTAGVGPTLYTAPSGTPSAPTTQSVPLVNPTDIMDTFAIQPTNDGGVGVAILEANLSSNTVAPTIYAGSIAASLMSNFVPANDVPATKLAGLANLPGINGGRADWQSFPAGTGVAASDNLLASGAEFPNANGINVLWWNGAGQLISNKSGSSAYFYFDTSDGGAGLSLYGSDIVFQSQPLPALAQFELTYLQQNPDPSADASSGVNVFANSVVCTP